MRRQLRFGLGLVGLLGSCASSTTAPDESGRADLETFCVDEATLVCESCDAMKCAAHPSRWCEVAMVAPAIGWPCDPEPTQNSADLCLFALARDPCGSDYPIECAFLACLGEGRP